VKQVYQTKFGEPEGNCFNACVASILECGLDELPDLHQIEQTGENWLEGLNRHLQSKGYGIIHLPTSEEKPVELYIPPGCHFIASGMGPRELLHSVVMRQEKDGMVMAHDPIGKKYSGLKDIRSFQLVVKLSHSEV
jgi:hypothetical protein